MEEAVWHFAQLFLPDLSHGDAGRTADLAGRLVTYIVDTSRKVLYFFSDNKCCTLANERCVCQVINEFQ